MALSRTHMWHDTNRKKVFVRSGASLELVLIPLLSKLIADDDYVWKAQLKLLQRPKVNKKNTEFAAVGKVIAVNL